MFKKDKKEKTTDKYSAKNLILRIAKEYILPNKFSFIIAIVFMWISSGLVGYRAYLMKPAIDKIFMLKDSKQLMWIAGQILVVGIVLCVVNYVHSIILRITNQKIQSDLQDRLFKNIVIKDVDYFKNRSSGTVLSYFNDIAGLMTSIDIILNGLILQFFTLVVLVGLMIYQNPKMSIISVFSFLFVIKPLMSITKKIKSIILKNKEGGTIFFSVVSESLDNIEVVKANGMEEYEIKKVSKTIDRMHRLGIKIAKQSLLTAPLMEFVSSLGFAMVLLYGGYSVINGMSTPGEFFTFLTAMLSAYKPAKAFSGLNVKMQTAIISAQRIYKIIDTRPLITESKNPITPKKIEGNIEMKNISFQYNVGNSNQDVVDEAVSFSDTLALNNVNLSMNSGHSYALVGHSGSGKSTIFKLILRFYDPTNGVITIDDINLKDLSFKTLRESISLVSQDVKLFDTSIFENIKYAKQDATYEEVINASKMANVHEFVETMENGYESIIGPNGTLLSGGQKQRISIARALLKNSPILLLDEATSALDPISEQLIQEALAKLMINKTTIIIAHRLSTIVNCNRIFVFEKGKLMEQGTHEELINNKFIYKNLCDKQFSQKTKYKNEE